MKKEPAIIKREKRQDWEKSKYIPEQNVIILKDNDDGSLSICFGNGKTNVNELPETNLSDIQRKDAKIESNTLIL